MFCAQTPRTCQKYPKCIQKKCKCSCWYLRRYVLRTDAQNLSKVSQTHPENTQEHLLENKRRWPPTHRNSMLLRTNVRFTWPRRMATEGPALCGHPLWPYIDHAWICFSLLFRKSMEFWWVGGLRRLFSNKMLLHIFWVHLDTFDKFWATVRRT